MKPSHLVLPYFNVREEKMETGLWICSALSHLSSGSATNQSLKFMPPLDEKGMGGKGVTDSPWKEWCERGDSEKKTDRQRRKSQEKDDFWAASSQKDFFCCCLIHIASPLSRPIAIPLSSSFSFLLIHLLFLTIFQWYIYTYIKDIS